MAWTKAKTAIVVGVILLVAVATAIIILGIIDKPVHGIPKDWTVLRGDSDQWNTTNGVISGHSTTGETILASGREYRDVTLSATAGTTNREASLAFRLQDANNGYLVIFAPAGTPRDDAGRILLIKKTDGNEVTLATYQGRVFFSLGHSAKIAVTAKGSLIEVRLNDVRVVRVMDTAYPIGLIGLRIFGDPEYPCDATFSKVIF